MKQLMREVMQVAMHEIQHQFRDMLCPHQTGRRSEEQPNVRLPATHSAPIGPKVGSVQRDPYTTLESPRRRENTLKIEKCGVKFDVDSTKMSIEDFIFRIARLKNYHRVSWEEVIGDFHKLLSHKVDAWYWTQVRMKGIPDWATLRAALKRTYSSSLTNFEL